MESQNIFWIAQEEYKDIDIQKIFQIKLKNGTILQINKNPYITNIENKNINYNIQNDYIPPDNNETSNLKKLKSFTNDPRRISIEDPFYVEPKPNKLIKIIPSSSSLSENNNFEPTYEKYIKNFTFEACPHKYNYKPYKPPARKHKLKRGINNSFN